MWGRADDVIKGLEIKEMHRQVGLRMERQSSAMSLISVIIEGLKPDVLAVLALSLY